jgi:hypothetical protein
MLTERAGAATAALGSARKTSGGEPSRPSRRVVALLASAVAAALAMLLAASTGSAMEAGRVHIEMRGSGCTVAPEADLAPGLTVFVVSNRSRRARRFAIAGRRTSFLKPGRTATLALHLHSGRVGYTCSARGSARSVRTGAIKVVRPPPVARIGIREGKFYDRVTGAAFVPRGSNYIRIAPQTAPDGWTFDHHSTFDIGRYDARGVESALARMEASGYNVVRVFFSGVCLNICLGDPATRGLRMRYLEHVVDFVRRAKAHGVQVMLTIDALPAGSTWSAKVHSNCCTAYDGFQQWFLPGESVAAFRDYVTVLVEALLDAGMPADGVFAYSLINEAFMDGDKPPFSLRSGTRTTANGQTYDLSSASQRRRMLEDGLVYWADVMVDAIHRVVPTSLVTIGFFHAHEPNPARRGDPRLIYTNEFLQRSRVDFFDFHPYPDDELTFPQFMENYGITGHETKPLLMGEYGASRRAYRTPEAAAAALRRWQFESCAWGFDGWLLWTWDTDEQTALWNGLSAGGVIQQALAPRRRVDPCALAG